MPNFMKLEGLSAGKLTMAFLLTVFVMLPDTAYAVGTELEDTVKNGLCVVVTALTGNVGKAIATLAVIFLGIGAFFGKVNWGLALMFGTGIVAIFGSIEIASNIAEGAGSPNKLTCP